jgi:hypothetical protein
MRNEIWNQIWRNQIEEDGCKLKGVTRLDYSQF